jgi:hypothetical protein
VELHLSEIMSLSNSEGREDNEVLGFST